MAPHLRPAARASTLGALALCACFSPSGSDSATTGETSSAGTGATGTAVAATGASTEPTAGTTVDLTTGLPGPDQGVPGGICPAIDVLDLENGAGGFVIRPEVGSFGVGFLVTGIGDFNGDGRDDVRVLALPKGTTDCGSPAVWRNYLVFGKTDTGAVQLAEGVGEPFVADGQGVFLDGIDFCMDPCLNQFGLALAGLGDLDADGHDDILVGAPRVDTARGRAYVFHGRPADGDNVHAGAAVASPTDHVFEGGDGHYAGSTVAGLGDIDGDGTPDLGLYVSAPGRAIHVVYGGPPPAADPFLLPDLIDPDQGYRIGDPPPDAYRDLGSNLQGWHDFDGDDVPDLLLDTGPDDASRIIVVFGNPGRGQSNASLDAFTEDGRATSVQCSESCGRSARFIGDINGDGLADIAAGEAEYDGDTGRVAVIFGAPQPRVVAIDALTPDQGFLVRGESGSDFFGAAVAGADLDGDGLADLAIGAPGHENNRGRVYVVLGRAGLSAVAVADLLRGQGGFVIDGDASIATMFGRSLDRAGRVDDDTHDDLVIGAPGVASDTCVVGEDPGRAYVLFGAPCRG